MPMKDPHVLSFAGGEPTTIVAPPAPEADVDWTAVRAIKAPRRAGGVQRMPRWYHTKREDPLRLPSESEFERTMREAEEARARGAPRGRHRRARGAVAARAPALAAARAAPVAGDSALRTGEQVAVKVRRPGIGNIFAADLRALRWLIGVVEFLAIIRPGSLGNLASELETAFIAELDLRREAYFQEIFRRNSQDPKRSR